MKKVLLPVEGRHYPRELLDFTKLLNGSWPLSLETIFVAQASTTQILRTGDASKMEEVSLLDTELCRLQCQSKRLERFHQDTGIRMNIDMNLEDLPLSGLRTASRYADLLLLSSEAFFSKAENDASAKWMRDLLHRSECPVLIAPEHAGLPCELILAYDGSADSVFAIRQFAYLFPELAKLPATLVYFNEEPGTPIPSESSIRELGKLNYKRFRMVNLRIASEGFFNTWIEMMNSPWLVTSSYARTSVSETFAKSLPAAVIRKQGLPVFMAHR